MNIMLNEPTITAKIVEILPNAGNRVYRLKLSEPIGRSEYVQLDLTDNPDEIPLIFYREIPANQKTLANVFIHNCVDFRENKNSDEGIFYAWPPRMNGRPAACPRCKRRIDFVSHV